MFPRWSTSVVGLGLLVICQLTIGQLTANEPLRFLMDKENPQTVRILWSPSVDMVRVRELASRDVRYVVNNATGKVREEPGQWRTLITEKDQVDKDQRLVFFKGEMCSEQDYKVSWYDQRGQPQPEVVQRMQPSPEVWSPTADTALKNIRFVEANQQVLADLSWSVQNENLGSTPKLGAAHPSLTLESCQSLFERPVAPPSVDLQTQTVTFDRAYLQHQCSFSVRLQQMTYNSERECRSLRETPDRPAQRVELDCRKTAVANCPPSAPVTGQQCAMTCEQKTATVVEFDWSKGWPRPFVKVVWEPLRVSSAPVLGQLIRLAEVDDLDNNFPLELFNTSVRRLPADQSVLELEPFSKDPDALYALQVCSLYEKCGEGREPNWSTVPQYPIRVAKLISDTPVPTTTTTVTTPTTTTTTTPPVKKVKPADQLAPAPPAAVQVKGQQIPKKSGSAAVAGTTTAPKNKAARFTLKPKRSPNEPVSDDSMIDISNDDSESITQINPTAGAARSSIDFCLMSVLVGVIYRLIAL